LAGRLQEKRERRSPFVFQLLCLFRGFRRDTVDVNHIAARSHRHAPAVFGFAALAMAICDVIDRVGLDQSGF
jgi:hypothetical protein